MKRTELDKLDQQILRMVAADARVPFLKIARACNVSGASIHQHVQKLTERGILKGSAYIVDAESIGYETCAFIGINLKNPSSFDDVLEKLQQIPNVVEIHYTTGKYDMFIKIHAHNNTHLLEIIHDKLQPLGLSRTETLISFKEVMNRQIAIPEDINDTTQE